MGIEDGFGDQDVEKKECLYVAEKAMHEAVEESYQEL